MTDKNQGIETQYAAQDAPKDAAQEQHIVLSGSTQSGSIHDLPAIADNDPAYLMEQFTTGSSLFFSTIQLDGTRETAAKVYNSISDTYSLRDNINVPLNVTDYMAHPVTLVDEQTGEPFTAIRVILVTEEGDAYAAVSKGIQSSIQRLVPIVGQAPWTPALRMKAVEKNVKSNAMHRVLTLQLVADVTIDGKKGKAKE